MDESEWILEGLWKLYRSSLKCSYISRLAYLHISQSKNGHTIQYAPHNYLQRSSDIWKRIEKRHENIYNTHSTRNLRWSTTNLTCFYYFIIRQYTFVNIFTSLASLSYASAKLVLYFLFIYYYFVFLFLSSNGKCYA